MRSWVLHSTAGPMGAPCISERQGYSHVIVTLQTLQSKFCWTDVRAAALQVATHIKKRIPQPPPTVVSLAPIPRHWSYLRSMWQYQRLCACSRACPTTSLGRIIPSSVICAITLQASFPCACGSITLVVKWGSEDRIFFGEPGDIGMLSSTFSIRPYSRCRSGQSRTPSLLLDHGLKLSESVRVLYYSM